MKKTHSIVLRKAWYWYSKLITSLIGMLLRMMSYWYLCLSVGVGALMVAYVLLPHDTGIPVFLTGTNRHFRIKTDSGSAEIQPPQLPKTFFDHGVYSVEDFKNGKGISPAFWKEHNRTTQGRMVQPVWGPCYPPQKEVDWDKSIATYYGSEKYDYHSVTNSRGASSSAADEDLSGFCRPGFLIIGQGKCGTSSLYHYLTGHPRVVPASEKQIHYFKVSER